MTKKGFIPQKLQPWIEARKKLRLSHAHIQMARELGLNPKKLGKLANTSGQGWKAPLPEYIVHLYRKSFGRDRPERVQSIEQVVEEKRKRKEERRARRAHEEEARGPRLTLDPEDLISAMEDHSGMRDYWFDKKTGEVIPIQTDPSVDTEEEEQPDDPEEIRAQDGSAGGSPDGALTMSTTPRELSNATRRTRS